MALYHASKKKKKSKFLNPGYNTEPPLASDYLSDPHHTCLVSPCLTQAVSSLSHSGLCAAAAAKSLQSCLALCDPVEGSPPGSTIPGILQARTLEWAAVSFSKWPMYYFPNTSIGFFVLPNHCLDFSFT